MINIMQNHDEVYHNKTVSIPKLHPIIWTVRNVHRLTVDSNCPCWRFTYSTSNKDNKIQIRMILEKSLIFPKNVSKFLMCNQTYFEINFSISGPLIGVIIAGIGSVVLSQ